MCNNDVCQSSESLDSQGQQTVMSELSAKYVNPQNSTSSHVAITE
jgi:hypothetical protein